MRLLAWVLYKMGYTLVPNMHYESIEFYSRRYCEEIERRRSKLPN